MTIRLYDDTTHQLVPKEPTDAMRAAFPSFGCGSRCQREAEPSVNEVLADIHAAAPPHGVALPTREEIAYALAKVQGYDKPLPHTHYEQADAILALIQEKMQGKEGG